MTIAVIDVDINETSRFGIMNTREDLSIYEFEEKPNKAKSTKASMGIYIFNWKILREFLIIDENDKLSDNDFGKNIIPKMLDSSIRLFAYPFKGYWKDVGTIKSLWEANMDLLSMENELNLYDNSWKIYSENIASPAQYIGHNSEINESLVVEGCIIEGNIEHSVIFQGVKVGKNSIIRNSVIMNNTIIGDNVIINKAIVGSNAKISRNCNIGNGEKIAVIASNEVLDIGTTLEPAEVL